jgi:hypothetical protein
MMKNNDKTLVKVISSFYFIIALYEILAYSIFNETLVFSTISIPVLLIALYFLSSVKQNLLFFSILIFLLIENVWTLFYDSRFSVGIICSSIQKIALIILIFKLIKERNYMYLSIVSLAFLLIFLYLFSTTSETSYVDFKFLMLQNILTSVLGGIAVSSYMIDDNRKNSWLLISILLFIGLRFMLFIQSFYLTDLTLPVIKPIIITLNIFAYFTLYKFVIEAEKNEIE